MRLVVAAALLVALFAAPCHSQTVISRSAGDAQGQFFSQGEPVEMYAIPGLGAGLVEDSTGLAVMVVPPPTNRPAEFKSVDLAEHDVIIMCNGKRTRTIAELRGLIDALAIGDDIKLAVRRGRDRIMVAFPKPDPDKYPKQQMMIMRAPGSPDGDKSSLPPGAAAVRLNLGPGQGTTLVLEAALLLADSDSGLCVQQRLPIKGAPQTGPDIAVGALVKEINGVAVTSADAFNSVYDKTPEGQEFAITFSVKGDEVTGRWTRLQPLQIRKARQSE
jgi:S1-C subfamily serine protease